MSEKCFQVQDQLLFYLDGEKIDPDLDSHLESCLDCQNKMHSLRVLRQLLFEIPKKKLPETALFENSAPFISKLPTKKLPQGFENRILDAIRQEKDEKVPQLTRGVWRFIQPMAAAVIIIYLTFSGYQSLQTKPEIKKTLNIEFYSDKSFYKTKLREKVSLLSKESSNIDIKSPDKNTKERKG